MFSDEQVYTEKTNLQINNFIEDFDKEYNEVFGIENDNEGELEEDYQPEMESLAFNMGNFEEIENEKEGKIIDLTSSCSEENEIYCKGEKAKIVLRIESNEIPINKKYKESEIIKQKDFERLRLDDIIGAPNIEIRMYPIFLISHKRTRKYKQDDIRKKLKARCHKAYLKAINENLIKAGSTQLFESLPQAFICDISRDRNKDVLNLTYKEIIQKNFVNEIETKGKNRSIGLANYKRNLAVLAYLEKNPTICRKSGFDIISEMKYSDLLNAYFISGEFDKSLIKLREKEDEEYVIEYENQAKSYVSFFSENSIKKKLKKSFISTDKSSEEDRKEQTEVSLQAYELMK